MPGDEVRIDPRVKRTRQLLENAFRELLEEKDFQSITVQDIAARAGVNRATFYAHFEDKYALLNYGVRDTLETMLESKLPESPVFALENLRVVTVTVCEFLAMLYGHCLPAVRTNLYLLIAAQVQMHIREVILGWLTRTTGTVTSSEAVATVTSWAIFGAALQWASGDRHQAPEQLADQVLAVMSSGLVYAPAAAA